MSDRWIVRKHYPKAHVNRRYGWFFVWAPSRSIPIGIGQTRRAAYSDAVKRHC